MILYGNVKRKYSHPVDVIRGEKIMYTFYVDIFNMYTKKKHHIYFVYE